MNQIVEEVQAIKVKRGDTVFLRPTSPLTHSEVEAIRRSFDGAELGCKVVILPAELEAVAIAE